MNRRSFLKAMLGAAIAVACPTPVPEPAPKKFRCAYSLESAQKLRAVHGLAPGEQELVMAMARELREEIDNTVLNEVKRFT